MLTGVNQDNGQAKCINKSLWSSSQPKCQRGANKQSFGSDVRRDLMRTPSTTHVPDQSSIGKCGLGVESAEMKFGQKCLSDIVNNVPQSNSSEWTEAKTVLLVTLKSVCPDYQGPETPLISQEFRDKLDYLIKHMVTQTSRASMSQASKSQQTTKEDKRYTGVEAVKITSMVLRTDHISKSDDDSDR